MQARAAFPGTADARGELDTAKHSKPEQERVWGLKEYLQRGWTGSATLSRKLPHPSNRSYSAVAEEDVYTSELQLCGLFMICLG